MEREDPGHIEAIGLRGVWVPAGLSGKEVMAGALALMERDEEIDIYTAQSYACTVLAAIKPTESCGLLETLGRHRSEFERCKLLGLPPPSLSELDAL